MGMTLLLQAVPSHTLATQEKMPTFTCAFFIGWPGPTIPLPEKEVGAVMRDDSQRGEHRRPMSNR